MNDTQRAKLAMLQTTLAVLDQHAARYATNKALGKARQTLADLVASLNPTADRQQRAATPERPAAVKQETKQLLAERTAEMAAALLALADELNDTSLHTDADYTERQLSRKPDNDLLRIAKHIHTRATEHAAALAEQDVTAAELTELAATIATFQQEQIAPRTTIADGKAQKGEINADLRQGTALLRNRVDKYMVRYRRPEPAFYTAYQSARRVINTAARTEERPTPQ